MLSDAYGRTRSITLECVLRAPQARRAVRPTKKRAPFARWPQRFAASVGPGYLCGITVGAWIRLLAANRFSVAPRCWPRAAAISALSVLNSLFALYERHRYRLESQCSPVAPEPIFVLGHWRSGTTHLHRLLTADERFVAPTLFEVIYPNSFRCTRGWLPRLLAPLVTPTRKIDNIPQDLYGPAEDEWALCALFGKSPYLSVAFPRSEEIYDRYLTLDDISDVERRQWQATLWEFVEKVMSAHFERNATDGTHFRGESRSADRTPLLKSPAHTCRIKLLLETFPRAKFVHIHRHPFDVFQSMRRLLAGWHERHHLQRRDLTRLDERIICQYKQMYESFFRERTLIPADRFHELRFDALERDPVRELRELYEHLSLPPFEAAEPRMRHYLDSVAEYKRNQYPELPAGIRARLLHDWRRSFEEWGYGDV